MPSGARPCARKDQLHPQARALIDLIEQGGLPPLNTLPAVEARLLYRDRRGLTQPPAPEVGSVRAAMAEGPHGPIALRMYRPLGSEPAAALPALVYFHGGGWTIGDLDTHDDGHASHTSNGRGYLLTTEMIDYYNYYMGNYIQEAARTLDWRASPLLCENLAGLPPALVLSAGYDPLRDEGMAYADALVAAGSPATYVCFERQIHGFITMGKLIDEAHAAVQMCAAELSRALEPAALPAVGA